MLSLEDSWYKRNHISTQIKKYILYVIRKVIQVTLYS